VDEREQLVNQREIGPVECVSLPEDLVTTIHGMMADIDLKYLTSALVDATTDTPAAIGLYDTHVRTWLDRDPILRHAEVRFSGTGLHVLLWFAPAVEAQHVGDRQRWRGMIAAVQCALPTDPTAPMLTALTRPVGSINGKTNAIVRTLRAGAPITPDEFRAHYQRVRDKPFATVARLLYGTERVSPCPVCQDDGRKLLAGERVGHCYGGCGTVKLERLMATLMATPAAKEV
jgi:hypothetical protein